MGDKMKSNHAGTDGEALKEALLILARSGMCKPGTSDGEASYVIRLDRQGAVQGVDVIVSEEFLGSVLDAFTTEPTES